MLAKNNEYLVIFPLGGSRTTWISSSRWNRYDYFGVNSTNNSRKSRESEKMLILPTLPYGFSYHDLAFPGTLSLSPEILEKVLTTLGKQLLSQGFKKLLLISWHGGHTSIMHDVCYELKKDFPERQIYYLSIIDSVFDKIKNIVTEPVYHADDLETSIMLALGQRVLLNKLAKDGNIEFLSGYGYLDFKKFSRVKIPVNVAEFSKSGVIGDPTSSSAEKGKILLEIISDELAKIFDKIVES